MILDAVAIMLYDIQGIIVGGLFNMPMSDALGLGRVSFCRIYFFPTRHVEIFIH